ncbi:MAG TPA: hypothetical protein VKF36_23930 [Syntrophorhabdales bacterium]|nr:hypothetical protein [Syntrophorhabdales bacterium]
MHHREQILGLLLAALALVSFFPAGSAWGQVVYSSWPQQTPPAFVVAPFVDAHTGSGDTSLLVTNTGLSYDLCADIYLFTTDGTMIGCCACPVKENGLLTLSMNDLTQNTTIGAAKTGVIKVVSSTNCDPRNPYLSPGLKIYERSLYTSSVPSPIVAVPDTPLSMFEFVGLERQCTAIQQQSSNNGPGICQCPGAPAGNPE